MVGICKLCQQSKELLNSHIFPKFVMRWMKKTGSGYIRFVKQPNVRKQDGPTARLLCSACEQRFSAHETHFSSQVFYPVLAASRFSFKYDERLIRFVVSLLWRIVIDNLEEATRANDPFLSDVLAAEEEWRRFLLGQQSLSRFAHVHLFVSDLSDENPPGVPHFNNYCTRAVDGVIITDTVPRFVYAKVARFMCVGLLSPYDEQKWIGTRLNEVGGALASPQTVRELAFGGFLYQRARAVYRQFESNLSNNQRKVITTHLQNNSNKILNSELGKAVLADHSSEVRYAGFKGKVGRNDPCPCGSGFKFKKCHGGNF